MRLYKKFGIWFCNQCKRRYERFGGSGSNEGGFIVDNFDIRRFTGDEAAYVDNSGNSYYIGRFKTGCGIFGRKLFISICTDDGTDEMMMLCKRHDVMG